MALIYGVNYKFNPVSQECSCNRGRLALWLLFCQRPTVSSGQYRAYCHECLLSSLRNIHDRTIREQWL